MDIFSSPIHPVTAFSCLRVCRPGGRIAYERQPAFTQLGVILGVERPNMRGFGEILQTYSQISNNQTSEKRHKKSTKYTRWPYLNPKYRCCRQSLLLSPQEKLVRIKASHSPPKPGIVPRQPNRIHAQKGTGSPNPDHKSILNQDFEEQVATTDEKKDITLGCSNHLLGQFSPNRSHYSSDKDSVSLMEIGREVALLFNQMCLFNL